MIHEEDVEILDDEYYLDIKENVQFGTFINIYDKETIERKPAIENLKTSRKTNGHELKKILKNAVSIIFYGDNAVKLGIYLKYIHPEAVGENKGIKTAIYIRTF